MSTTGPVAALPAGTGRPVLGLIAVIALVIAGLTALDRFLAKVENEEVQGSAQRSYETGRRLLGQGLAAKALDPLRQAHALERDNSGYTLDLIGALIALGKTGEADTLMDDILAARPNDGEANLVAARLMLKEDKLDDAEAYYHRAVYGSWPADSEAHQRAARLELIKLLVDENARQQLQGELIVLESEADGDMKLQKQLAHLFLVADAPARAAAVYRELTDRNPADSEAWAGLGEAELEEGQYRAAQSAFLRASNNRPDSALQPRLQLLTQLTELDPTPRRLTSMEKYNRSLRILGLAKSDFEAQLASKPGMANPDVVQLLKEASDELAKDPPRGATNEMAEHELDLAERIWKARLAMFGASTSTEEEPLRLCMEKLLQGSPAA
jgi:tetratricopeptide (TPR) repeat protein